MTCCELGGVIRPYHLAFALRTTIMGDRVISTVFNGLVYVVDGPTYAGGSIVDLFRRGKDGVEVCFLEQSSRSIEGSFY